MFISKLKFKGKFFVFDRDDTLIRKFELNNLQAELYLINPQVIIPIIQTIDNSNDLALAIASAGGSELNADPGYIMINQKYKVKKEPAYVQFSANTLPNNIISVENASCNGEQIDSNDIENAKITYELVNDPFPFNEKGEYQKYHKGAKKDILIKEDTCWLIELGKTTLKIRAKEFSEKLQILREGDYKLIAVLLALDQKKLKVELTEELTEKLRAFGIIDISAPEEYQTIDAKAVVFIDDKPSNCKSVREAGFTAIDADTTSAKMHKASDIHDTYIVKLLEQFYALANDDTLNLAVNLIEYALKSYVVNSIDMLDEVFKINNEISEKLINKLNVFIDDNLKAIIQTAADFHTNNSKTLAITAGQETFCNIIASYHLTRLIKCFQTPSYENNPLKNIIDSIINKITECNKQLKKLIFQGNEIDYYSFIVGPVLSAVPEKISQGYNEQLWEIAIKSQNFQLVQALVSQGSFPHYQSAEILCQAMLKDNHLIYIVLEQPNYLGKMGFKLTIAQAYRLLAIAYKENQKEEHDSDKQIAQFEKLIITPIENEAIEQYVTEPKKLIEIMTDSIAPMDKKLLQMKLNLLKTKTVYAQYIIGSIWVVRNIVAEICGYLEPQDVANLGLTCKTLAQKVFNKSATSLSIFKNRLSSSPQFTQNINKSDYSQKSTKHVIGDNNNTLYLPTIFSSWRNTYMAAAIRDPFNKFNAKVKIWSMKSFDCIATLNCKEMGENITSINKLKGPYLAFGNNSGMVSIWNFEQKKMIKSYNMVKHLLYFGSVHEIVGVIDRDKNIVVILTRVKVSTLYWVNKESGIIEDESTTHKKITAYKLISNNRIALGFKDRVLQIRDLTPNLLHLLPNTIMKYMHNSPPIKDFALLGTNQLLCLCEDSNVIHIFSLKENDCVFVASKIFGSPLYEIASMTVIGNDTVAICLRDKKLSDEGLADMAICKITSAGTIAFLSYEKNIPFINNKKLAFLPGGQLIRTSKDGKGIDILTFSAPKEPKENEENKCTIF